MTETLAHGYSSESTIKRELSNEYQHDMVRWFSKICISALWTKVASALEGLRWSQKYPYMKYLSTWIDGCHGIYVIGCMEINNLSSSVLYCMEGFPRGTGRWLGKC